MKAFLLAAGLGTRLRPLTDRVPKCMLVVGDRPLLDIWLDAFDRAGVDEVLVNLHHLPEVVQEHLGSRSGPPLVRTAFEPRLLGSAGTLLANRKWVAGEELFLACNADNLTDFDLRRLIDAHACGGTVATVAAFYARNPSMCGILALDDEGLMTSYAEKPSAPSGRLANAGMYAFSPRLLEEFAGFRPKDLGYDVLPRLVGRARATMINGYFRDIGTPESYRLALDEWRPRVLR